MTTPRLDNFSVQKIAEQFRLLGLLGLWVKIIIGVVAGLMIFVGVIVEQAGSAGLSGVPFTIAGLITLFISAYWCSRYQRLSRQLRASDTNVRPSRAETISILRKGLLITLIGFICSIIGSEAVAGIVFLKALNSGAGSIMGIAGVDPSRYIQPVDMFVVLANAHLVTGHTIGLGISLWLLNKLIR